jgi:hypothetical protein
MYMCVYIWRIIWKCTWTYAHIHARAYKYSKYVLVCCEILSCVWLFCHAEKVARHSTITTQMNHNASYHRPFTGWIAPVAAVITSGNSCRGLLENVTPFVTKRCVGLGVGGGSSIQISIQIPSELWKQFQTHYTLTCIPMERNVLSWWYFHSYRGECAVVFSVNTLFSSLFM